MQVPGEVAAQHSFLFPIGESRVSELSHPTVRAMCVNGTLLLANPLRRPHEISSRFLHHASACLRSRLNPPFPP